MRILLITLVLLGYSATAQSTRLNFDHGVTAAEAGNYAEAYCIWRPLADVGHAEAQYRLGWLYAKGLGLAVNESTALYWWEQAANLGHTEALFRLGWAYEHGEGVQQDMSSAIQFYLEAARHQQEDAQEILQDLLMRDNPEVEAGIAKLLKSNPQAMGEYTSVAVKRANVRGGPNKNKKLVTTLSKDDAVIVLGNVGSWLRIWMIEQQRFGWIFNRLITGYEKNSG